MVIGFLKDNRLDQERKRADEAVALIAELQAKVAESQVEAAVAQAAVRQERERADRYFAELEKMRESYARATEMILQHLADVGWRTPNPDDNP